jgi:hypothetical protein
LLASSGSAPVGPQGPQELPTPQRAWVVNFGSI